MIACAVGETERFTTRELDTVVLKTTVRRHKGFHTNKAHYILASLATSSMISAILDMAPQPSGESHLRLNHNDRRLSVSPKTQIFQNHSTANQQLLRPLDERLFSIQLIISLCCPKGQQCLIGHHYHIWFDSK